MKVSVIRMGKLVTDQPGYQLSASSITVANNVQYRDGQVESADGHEVYFTSSATAYHVKYVDASGSGNWIYLGLDNAYLFDGSTSSNITRSSTAYTGSEANRWNSCSINKALVFNNGYDVPQMMTSVSPTTLLEDLTAWPATATAKVIRTYKSFLIALNVTKPAGTYPNMVKWSDSADSGTVPSTWDETDPTNLAGEYEISETRGACVDGLNLRDQFIIYKEDSVYSMQFTGGINVFRITRLKDQPGILAQQCAVNFKGGHFVVSAPSYRSLYVSDGNNFQEVGLDIRDGFFDQLSPDYYERTYCEHNRKESEIWIMFPTGTGTFPNKALIWNYLEDNWSYRDIPASTHSSVGVVGTLNPTWQSTTDTWATVAGTWASPGFSKTNQAIVMPSSNILYQYGVGNQFDGVNAPCTIERTSIMIGENEYRVYVNKMFPHATGGQFNVHIGTQNSPNESITWQGPYAFDPDTDHKIDFRATGMLHSVRFSSQDNVKWAVTGYDLVYSSAGKR